MKKNFTLFMLAFFWGAGFVFAQTIRYVKPTGTGNGSTWANASGDLQAMIDASASGDEVWVAAGTYLPTVGYPDNSNSRYVAFKLKNGVHIYGGFNGTDDNAQTIAGRDLDNNKTILSGDIGTVGTHTDNAYHVMLALNLTTETTLDGLTITRGYANGSVSPAPTVDGFSLPTSQGAALTVRNSKLNLSNVLITDNFSNSAGCGINMQTTSELSLNKCIIQNNRLTFTGNGGGAILASGLGQKISISECQFINNRNEGDATSTSSFNNGGAISFVGTTGTASTLEITNTKFINNYTANRGGALYLATNINVTKFENIEFNNNTTRLTSLVTDKEGYFGGAVCIWAGVNIQSVKNLTFTNNKSGQSGGAMYISQNTINPKIENLLCYNNSSVNGGAIYLDNSKADIVGATFYKNTATTSAGAIYYNSGSARTSEIYNSLFIANDGGTGSDNLRTGNGTFDVYNSAFNGTGTGTDKGGVVTDVNETDIFKSVTATDDANFLRLKEIATNPAIDKGLNSVVTTSTDLAGNIRTINATALAEATVDMGAYENQVTTLPVTLLNFTAKASGKTTVLNWATANETNNNYFIIERSADGKTFKQLTKVNSKGSGAPYSYTDYSPLNGDNYYRLSQVDLDGTVKVVGNQVVKHTLDMVSVTVYPNPVVDKATISFGNVSYTKLQLVDSFGRLLQSQDVTKHSKQATLDLSIYPKGIYYVKLANNDSLEVKKIIK